MALSFFAISATTGAVPVPVPPPIPAVINTRSEPLNNSSISSAVSLAHLSATSGNPPAPNPLVIFSPIRSFSSASTRSNACLSVLIAIVLAPFTPSLLSLVIVFPPAPPHPIMVI